MKYARMKIIGLVCLWIIEATLFHPQVSSITNTVLNHTNALRRVISLPTAEVDKFTVSLGTINAYKGEIGQKARDLGVLAGKGIPVPEGFVITRNGYGSYKETGEISTDLWQSVLAQLKKSEEATGKKFGDAQNPLLLSVRSAPPQAMPGILATVVNIGISDSTIEGLARARVSSVEGLRFAYDTYRVFIESFATAVYSEEIEEDYFTRLTQEFLRNKGRLEISMLSAEEMQELCLYYRERLNLDKGIDIPQDAHQQLRLALSAVFSSWQSSVAKEYRSATDMSDEPGPEVIIQRMVFGNLDTYSGSGVGYFGKKLVEKNGIVDWQEIFYRSRVQGTDVMTPSGKDYGSLKVLFPGERSHERIYRQLSAIFSQLRNDYTLPQEVEFVVESEKVYILQIRPAEHLLRDEAFLVPAGFRNPAEAIGSLQEQETVMARKNWQVYRKSSFPVSGSRTAATGNSFSRGAVRGQLCLSLEEAEKVYLAGGAPILLTTHRDEAVIKAMIQGRIAGIITTYGNKVMHEAVIARTYLIPILLAEMLNIGEGMLLQEGSEVVLVAGEYRGVVAESIPGIELSDPISQDVVSVDYEHYTLQVRQEIQDWTYEEVKEEHVMLWDIIDRCLRNYRNGDTELSSGSKTFTLEEFILLNLRAHILHQVMLEKAGSNTQDTQPHVDSVQKFNIADIQVVVAEQSTFGDITYGYGRDFFDGNYANVSMRIQEDLGERRYFLCMVDPSITYSSNSEVYYRDLIEQFLGFATEWLRKRNKYNYLSTNSISVTGSNHQNIAVFDNFYGISFPKEKLSEVLEILTDWEISRKQQGE